MLYLQISKLMFVISTVPTKTILPIKKYSRIKGIFAVQVQVLLMAVQLTIRVNVKMVI